MTRRKFSEAFQADAVVLVVDRGMTTSRVVRDLGLGVVLGGLCILYSSCVRSGQPLESSQPQSLGYLAYSDTSPAALAACFVASSVPNPMAEAHCGVFDRATVRVRLAAFMDSPCTAYLGDNLPNETQHFGLKWYPNGRVRQAHWMPGRSEWVFVPPGHERGGVPSRRNRRVIERTLESCGLSLDALSIYDGPDL